KQLRRWRSREYRMDRPQYAELANHVVRFGRYRAERRPPQHVLRAIQLQQIRQIRMAARKLLHREHAAAPQPLPIEQRGESRQIELLFDADSAGVGWRSPGFGQPGYDMAARV